MKLVWNKFLFYYFFYLKLRGIIRKVKKRRI